MTAWAAVVSAIGTIVSAAGILAAFWQVSLLKAQISDDDVRSHRQLAIESMREWVRMQPPNAAACIALFGNFSQTELEAVAARRAVVVPTVARDLVPRCFADEFPDDIKALYDGDSGRLLPKGVSKFAARVNVAINSDEILALAAEHGIGDSEMILEELAGDISHEEIQGIARLRSVAGHEHAWPALEWLVTELDRKRTRSLDARR